MPETKILFQKMQESERVLRFNHGEQRRCSPMSEPAAADGLFERLYSQFADDVLRVSYFYLGDRQKAEDVCQDVFLRLLTRTPDIQPGHEKAWLLKVALNRCRDLWRAAWVKRVVLGSPFDCIPAPDDIEFRTEKADLMEAVAKLPPSFKEVILLHYYQGFGIAEIAAMLELPEGTISSRLSRARKKLEVLLKGGEEP
jgi:RNA polymerase sigma-70 factor (ECF subfamily)